MTSAAALYQHLKTITTQERFGGFSTRGNFEGDDYRFYARFGRYYFDRSVCDETFVIASVDIHPPGQGTFTELLRLLLVDPFFDMIVVECVHNERLAAMLQRNGFLEDPLRPTNWGRVAGSGMTR